ncbi:MAG: protein translocase subunit [Piccolia ochrophora]|nr:MAG: protein translocase subunit [Piccolia ochrophora]
MDSINNNPGGMSSDPKTTIMNEVRQEMSVNNARELIEKINVACFEKCVPKPGASLSSGEKTCFSQCMEKYMATWNAVSQSYMSHVQSRGSMGGGM